MLRTRKQSKHNINTKHQTKRIVSDCSKESSEDNGERRDELGFKRTHKNACRTKVCEFLEYRSQRMNRLRHPSMWLISKTYLKKLEQVQIQPPEESQQPKARKISWSEEAEYVYFNHRKSSASISSSERHTFFLDE